jgi:hypothetical protein
MKEKCGMDKNQKKDSVAHYVQLKKTTSKHKEGKP